MRFFKFRVVPLVLFLYLYSASFAQTDLEKANRYFAELKYNFAISYYQKAIDKNPSPVAMEKLGDCYRFINDSKDAELWYGKALALDPRRTAMRNNYADALRNNAKYDEAIAQYEMYGRAVSADSAKTAREISSCRNAKDWMAHPKPVLVTNEPGLNTRYSEFSPILYKKGVIFTTDRIIQNGKVKDKEEDKDIYGWTGNSFLKLFYSEYTPGKWGPALPLPKSINAAFHDGPATFNAASRLMCFTRTIQVKDVEKLSPLKLKNIEPVIRKQLFFAKEDNKDWKNVRSFKYNNPAVYSIQHPAFSPDGKYLYFSSDMPGGYGKFDLYVSERLADTTWSTPINLGGKINTAEDEGFPMVSKDSTLYFSSNGLMGMGGLDLFSAKGSGASWLEPLNLKYPFNSSKDDFGILFLKENELGFLSSNRDGGVGSDDIFRFKMTVPVCQVAGKVLDSDLGEPMRNTKVYMTEENGLVQESETDSLGAFSFRLKNCGNVKISAVKPGYSKDTKEVKLKGSSASGTVMLQLEKGISITLEGKVMDKSSKSPVVGAIVALIDLGTGDADKVLTQNDGKYMFVLQKGHSYKLVGHKEEYFPDKATFDTEKIKKASTMRMDLKLDKIEVDKVFVIQNIHYDRNRSEIRPDARPALNDLVSLMKQNPGMQVEIGSHTDSRSSKEYNSKLSDRRAKAVVEYLVSQGISSSRLMAMGYGEEKLVNRCSDGVECTEEEHQENRRTEFKVTGIEK